MAKKKKTSNKSSSGITINKVSCYLIFATAILYLVAMVLHLVDISSIIVSALQGIATAIMIIVVAILAWRYVRQKALVWKILYVVCLLVVLVGIVIPLVL